MTPPKRYTLSDLTIGEVKILTKDFLVACFACLLIFGIPYLLIIGLWWGVESVVPEEQSSWLSRAVVLILFLFVAVKVLEDIPYTFKYFGDMFQNMSTFASSISRKKQILWLIFIIAYFYSATKFPTAWFWFTILVFMPVGFTFDTYRKMLDQKADKEGDQNTSSRTA